jgi:hypothetical protein
MTAATGLPDVSCSKRTKTGEMHQMTTNYTKRTYIIPNGCKIFQMVIKYTNISIPRTSKNCPNWDFLHENKPSGIPGLHHLITEGLGNTL